MTRVICTTLTLTFVLSIAPALSGDTFYAFSTISPTAKASLAPLPDDRPAARASGKRLAGTRGKVARAGAPHGNELLVELATPPSAMPAIADDTSGETFRAFSNMPAVEQSSLIPLPDDQLSTVQGKEMVAGGLVLLPILNPLFGILDPAMLAILMNCSTSSVSQVQQNTGGAIQVNMIEIRQQ